MPYAMDICIFKKLLREFLWSPGLGTMTQWMNVLKELTPNQQLLWAWHYTEKYIIMFNQKS